MSPVDRLGLLRAAVAAKVAYWEANCALERELCGLFDISDADADHIEETIEMLAVGVDSPDDVSCVEQEHLDDLVKELE